MQGIFWIQNKLNSFSLEYLKSWLSLDRLGIKNNLLDFYLCGVMSQPIYLILQYVSALIFAIDLELSI